LGQAFFILLIVLASIGLLVPVMVNAWRRSQTLVEWAFAHGLEFDSAHDNGFGNRYPHFACLGKGQDEYAYNVMQGRMGNYPFCAFDYHGRSGGDEAAHCDFSAVIVTTNLLLKPLLIRHASVFDRVAAAVGFETVQFELAEFNRQFCVTSPDRRWAFDVLPQTTMEFLMNSPKFILEFQLCQIIAYRGSRFRPADFESAFKVIEGILRRLPASLVQELK
jgi:hypothetical protein